MYRLARENVRRAAAHCRSKAGTHCAARRSTRSRFLLLALVVVDALTARPVGGTASVPPVLSVAEGTVSQLGALQCGRAPTGGGSRLQYGWRLHSPGQTPSADRSDRPRRFRAPSGPSDGSDRARRLPGPPCRPDLLVRRLAGWVRAPALHQAVHRSRLPLRPRAGSRAHLHLCPEGCRGLQRGPPVHQAGAAGLDGGAGRHRHGHHPREADGSIGREVLFTPAGRTGLRVLLSESADSVEEIRRLRTTRRPIGVQEPKATPQQTRHTVRATSDETHDFSSPDRADVMAALEQAVSDGRSRTEVRRWLNRAEEVTHGGATAEENGLIRAAVDALLRLERAVRLPTPREPTFQERKALQKVQRLLGDLAERKRLGFPSVTPPQRRQLAQAAEQASAWLTDAQRSQVQAWQTAPTESAPAPRAPQSPVHPRAPRIPPAAPHSVRFDAACLADAVRDVREHAARLGNLIRTAAASGPPCSPLPAMSVPCATGRPTMSR